MAGQLCEWDKMWFIQKHVMIVGSTFVAPQITAELIDRDLSRTLKVLYM